MKTSRRIWAPVLLLTGLYGVGAWADFQRVGRESGVAFGGEFNEPLLPPLPPGPPMVMHGPFGHVFHLMALLDVLDLDKEQRQRVGKVMDEAMPKMRDLLFRLSDARKALEKTLEGDAVSDTELRRLADEQGRLTADMMFLHLKVRSDVRAILTPEQVEKLEEFHGEHGPRVIKRLHHRLHG